MSDRELIIEEQAEDEINIGELLVYLLNRWYVIIASVVVCAVVAGIVTNTEITPMYSSSSELFVARAGQVTTIADLQIGSYMTENYIVISQSKPVIDTAIQALYEQTGVQITREQASAATNVSEIENTSILCFTVTMDDPYIACNYCNALTDAMADQIAYITNSERPTIVESAEANLVPVNINDNNNREILIGAAGGFVLSVAVLCVLFLTNDKIITAEDIEKYVGAPVLVSIPMDKSSTFKKSKKSSKK